MFENYNLNDLFLASIDVTYPDDGLWETNIGGIFMEKTAGYGYVTLLLRNEDGTFIDLGKMRPMMDEINPMVTSYTINYEEPFSKYYKGNRTHFSRRRALLEAEKCYNIMTKEHFEQIKAQEEQQQQEQSTRGL